MSLRRPGTWVLCGLLIGTVAAAASSTIPSRNPSLSFSQRVAAQRAIERVYYEHQIGATLPFDKSVPDELLEKKVRLYLKQSAALANIWNTPVTAGMLRAEWERIARSTRMPGRLAELYAALDHDPILIQECLVRPVLVDRLARSFYSHDRVIHAEARGRAEQLFERLSRRVGESDAAPSIRKVADIIRENPGRNAEPSPRSAGAVTMESTEFDRMRATLPSTPGEIGSPQEEPDAFIIRELLDEGPDRLRVATWRVEKRSWDDWWLAIRDGIDESSIAIAAAGDLPAPVTTSAGTGCAPADSWSESLVGGPPRPRVYHAAVWTGSLMLVWGGEGGWSTGGRYDPATDTWAPTTLVGAPSGPRPGVTAVWTGSLMVVWGGSLTSNTGGRYDPVSDRWLPVSVANAPEPRIWHTAVWTGSRMIIWGGRNGVADFGNGGQYDPVSDSWSSIPASGAPFPRNGHTAVWTGSRMVIWGGTDFNHGVPIYLGSGARYDPVSGTWMSVASSGLESRSKHTAVWTGSRMIIWGGWNSSFPINYDNGARYDPVGDTWSPITTTGAPPGRREHTAIWTGSRMIIWGGVGPAGSNGALYDPATDQWTPSSPVLEPARFGHTAVWTSSRMIVWGGRAGSIATMSNNGVRYDPATDTLTQTADGEGTTSAPGVWTGSLMIFWGRTDTVGGLTEPFGARYDPATDSWAPTTQLGAPSFRIDNTLVWAGNVMVVWGGWDNQNGTFFNSGARYDPLADTWTPTSTTQAPSARIGHTAVWTGSVMVVWGGTEELAGGDTALTNTGGRYDPSADTWSSTRTSQAPDARDGHTAIWTGSRMIIWGGALLNSGGRYDPSANRWDATSLTGAPDGRFDHTAVWTGNQMVVWGGWNGNTPMNTGGSYDPASDLWLSTSTVDAPTARYFHTSVWLSDRMMTWGGYTGTAWTPGGGLYDPATDTWSPANVANAPPEMIWHTAVSLGDSMIVRGKDSSSNSSISGGHYFHAAIDSDADQDGASLCAGDCDDTNATVYPGAAQSCGDGVNNDCLSLSWPSLGQTNEGDDDGDGFPECAGDCSDTDPSSWTLPGEALALDLMPDGSTLFWEPPSSPGGSALSYDTLRSSLGSDFVAPAICVETADPVDLTAHDPLDPPLGEVFFYVVRASNGCGSGTLGFASDGSQRPGRTCP